MGIKPASIVPPTTLQWFVDDNILFGSSSVGEAKGWKSFLKLYADTSGQDINYDKRNIYFFHTFDKLQTKIRGIMCF